LLAKLFNRTSRRFAGIDFMDLVPRHRIDHEKGPSEGLVTLLIPRFSDPIFGRLLQPRMSEAKKFIRLPLEARGSILWLNMDGKTSVGDMVRILNENFGEDQQEVPERLSGYLFSMWENKFIEFENLP